MEHFIHIKSKKFPILPGEEEELVNPGTYGKALCQYMVKELEVKGWKSPFIVCEDWGWWIEIEKVTNTSKKSRNLCIYCTGNPTEYVCCPPDNPTKEWSWTKFKFVEIEDSLSSELYKDCISIFNEEDEIELIGVFSEMPI